MGMELGYGYIQDCLNGEFGILASSRDRNATYGMPTMYREQKPLDSKRIYVADLKDMQDCMLDEDVLFIVQCDSGSKVLDWERYAHAACRARCICVNAHEGGCVRLLEFLLDVFYREAFWNEQLWKLHCKGGGNVLKAYLDASVAFFDDVLVYYPVSGWRSCIYSDPLDKDNTHLPGLIDEDGLYSEQINYDILGCAIETNTISEVALTDRFGIEFSVLAVSVRGAHDSYEGLLLAPLAKKGATRAQKWHLRSLKHSLEAFLESPAAMNASEDASPYTSLKLLLAGNSSDLHAVKRDFKTFGLSYHGHYVCAVVKLLEGGDCKPIPLRRYCLVVEGMLEGCLAVEDNSEIVMLLDADRCNFESGGILKEFLEYFSMFDMRIGISFPFEDILDLAQYRNQAEAALEVGLEVYPKQRVHFFVDVASYYILLHGTEKMPARMLCVPGISDLDKKSNDGSVDYFATIVTYIENLYNATQTAEILGIHRSTLQYRLDRISEMVHLDLDSPKDRLYLELSLALLRWH